jgi:mitochondrial enoyl-[acyl-carrier protein] reductase / trans-2-enoyl-CoA reductase
MKAAFLHGFGKPDDVLRIEPMDLAEPGNDEVQIEMLASPINPADLNVIAGTYGELPDLPAIIGNEGAGRIVRLGAGAAGLALGTMVALPTPGSWCRRRNVRASDVIPLPDGIDPFQAAIVSVNPPTAYAMLHDFVSLQPGDWVVQNAGNSGVGRCVIQLAKQRGFRTLNVVRRAELVDELLALGADRVVTEDTDLRSEKIGAKLALNAVGGASALNIANALAPGGTLVTYGAMSRQALKIPNGLLIFKGLSFRGFWLRQWLAATPPAEQQRVFQLLAERVADGSLRVPVHASYPLDALHEALEAATQESRGGKILLDLQA